jgi:Gas vesicle synthesis protein GvpL/GvpF
VNESPASVLYLYGFAQPGLINDAEGATVSAPSGGRPTGRERLAAVLSIGIDETHSPFLWPHAGSAAIASWVSSDEFCGPAAEVNLQNLSWLSPRVLRHQAVLETVMRTAAVLPARFATLFSSLEVLSRFMEDRRETIISSLVRVGGHEEWAVKGFLDRLEAEEGLLLSIQTAEGFCAAGSPGLAYLREQHLRLRAKQELEDRLARICQRLLDELRPLASEIVSRPRLSEETTGATMEMILNWACLAPQAGGAALQERVEQANARPALPGLRFVLSGPWPPYSFCRDLALETSDGPGSI